MKQITKLLNKLWLYLESQVIHIIKANTIYKDQLQELSTQVSTLRDSLEKLWQANIKLKEANNRINTKANYQASKFEDNASKIKLLKERNDELTNDIINIKAKNKELIWKIALHNACHNK